MSLFQVAFYFFQNSARCKTFYIKNEFIFMFIFVEIKLPVNSFSSVKGFAPGLSLKERENWVELSTIKPTILIYELSSPRPSPTVTHLSCRCKAVVAHMMCLPTILCESFARMRPSGRVRLVPSSSN